MGKPTKKELLIRETDTFRYRWEFVRRNTEYLKDYKCLASLMEKYPPHEDYDKHEEVPYYVVDARVQKEADRLSKKWAMPIVNPDISADDILEIRVGRSDKTFEECLIEEKNFTQALRQINQLLWHTSLEDQRLIIESLPATVVGAWKIIKYQIVSQLPRFIEVKIDLESSKDKILRLVEDIIDDYKDRRKKKSKRELNKETRARFADYAIYLKVYDLKKEKKTYDEIAKIVYPNEYKDPDKHNYDSLIMKVKRNNQSCKRLIGAEYRQIR